MNFVCYSVRKWFEIKLVEKNGFDMVFIYCIKPFIVNLKFIDHS